MGVSLLEAAIIAADKRNTERETAAAPQSFLPAASADSYGYDGSIWDDVPDDYTPTVPPRCRLTGQLVSH